MSLIWIDGFDGYGSDNNSNFATRMSTAGYSFNDVGSPTVLQSSSTRTGVGQAVYEGLYTQFSRAHDLQPAIIWGGACYFDSNLSFRNFLLFDYDNYAGSLYNALTLFVNPTGALSVNLPGLGSQYYYSPVNTVYYGTWHYIEVKYAIASGSVTFEVHVDGNTVISETVVIPGGAPWMGAGINYIRFGQQTYGAYMAFDDMYLLSCNGTGYDDFLGDVVVHTMIPATDAGPNQTTQYAGSGTHASNVNSYPDDETTVYLYSNTPGQQELFTISAFPSDIIDVLAVQINTRARKDSAGVATYNMLLNSRGTLDTGPSVTPTVTMLEQHWVVENDPAGGTWTTTNAQNIDIGFQVE